MEQAINTANILESQEKDLLRKDSDNIHELYHPVLTRPESQKGKKREEIGFSLDSHCS